MSTINPAIEDRQERPSEPLEAGQQGQQTLAQRGAATANLSRLEAAQDVSPLLGIELADAENTGENSATDEDSNRVDLLAPLLGTICSHPVENAGKSSQRPSPESVCYDKLLRDNGPSSAQKSHKTVVVEGRGCYSHVARFIGRNASESSR